VQNITMTNNLYVAPNLTTGSHSTAPVQIQNGDLSGFKLIANNVWPMPTILTYAQGGINFVGTQMNSGGYKTPAEWDAYACVKNEQYHDCTLTTSYQVSLGGVTAGAAMKRAA
jgi:hypothetical protein